MFWATSSASASPSRYRRQMDQISGAYRSTSACHACVSPFLARVTRAVTTGSSRIGEFLPGRCVGRGLVCLLRWCRLGNVPSRREIPPLPGQPAALGLRRAPP